MNPNQLEISKTIYSQSNPDFYASYSENDDPQDGAEYYATELQSLLEQKFPTAKINIAVAPEHENSQNTDFFVEIEGESEIDSYQQCEKIKITLQDLERQNSGSF